MCIGPSLGVRKVMIRDSILKKEFFAHCHTLQLELLASDIYFLARLLRVLSPSSGEIIDEI